MIELMRNLIPLLVLILFLVPDARASGIRKHGFVVGIQNFKNLPDAQLINPVRDAEAVFGALRDAGFELIADQKGHLLRNLTFSEFQKKWSEFLSKIRPGDWAFIYVSSHGHSIGGRNYILPSDAPYANYRTKQAYTRHLISLNAMEVMLLDKDPKVTIFVVDACRDDPFVPDSYKMSSTRRGNLTARPTRRAGMLQLYSAQPGSFAYDRLRHERKSEVKHSLFARFFVPAIKQHSRPLGPLISEVRRNVYEASSNEPIPQYPNLDDSLPNWENLCLSTCKSEATIEPTIGLQARAERGEAAAQAQLGSMYEKGLGGFKKDQREAVRLYKLAAEQGNAQAQANLGLMYDDGLGGLQEDDREAVRLYKLAAEQGDAQGQRFLAYMYRKGLGGLKTDEHKAVRLYKLAAEQGNAGAQRNLGYMYDEGLGGLKEDDREAVRLYKLAAERL
ncbi:MAG: caspase family protein [Pseudomonadota bacterium]